MKDLILLLAVSAVFLGCYIAIKKITLFSSETVRLDVKPLTPSSETPQSRCVIKTKMPVPMQKNFPNCRMTFFRKTACILKKLFTLKSIRKMVYSFKKYG